MQFRHHAALAAVLSLLALSPVRAADNYPIKDSAGATRTVGAKDVGGVLYPKSIAIDGSGVERFTSGNPASVVLPSGQIVVLGAGSNVIGSVAISGAVPLPTGAATAAAQATVSAALGGPGDPAWNGTDASASMVAILKGLPRNGGSSSSSLSQGAVTTAAPTYTTGTNQGLSLTTIGALRVDGSGATQPVSSLALGAPGDAAWDGTSPNASITSILKGLPRTAGGGGGTTSSVTVTSLPALVAGTNTIGSIANISGTISLPTGASTAANQTTANTALASIDTKMPAKGATTAANSQPVTIATDQTAVPTETIIRSTSTNRGGVLTTAGTAQTLVPANTARRGLAIQNRNAPGASYSAATSVFMSCLTTATTDFNSLEIPAGALYETPSHHSGTGACSFVSGTANTPVYVREF